MEDEPTEIRPLSETELCVRYKGTSNARILSERDLSGDPEKSDLPRLVWSAGGEISYKSWQEYAGSKERALECLALWAFEFELVGPGAAELSASVEGEEDFAIGGLVAE